MEKIVVIREAQREDCQEIRSLIQELADYEEMPDGPKIDCQVLDKDGFGRADPLFNCFVAVSDERVVGYALYFYIYTTLGHTAIHLEDLYVTPEYRNKYVGSRLFEAVAKKTFRENCQFLDFSVLSWNPAQDFYKAKGSVDLTEIEGWHMFRIDKKLLHSLKQYPKSDCYQIREANTDDLSSVIKLAQNFLKCDETIAPNSMNDQSRQKVYFINLFQGSFKGSTKYFPRGYLVAEQNGEIKGYALHCFAYSTWEGKSMYLQELVVSSDALDASNMKRDLFMAVAKKARDEMCSRIDFWISDYKNEGQFYKLHGANDLTESEEWHLYRLFELKKKPPC